jgi:PIN domain nuclease of toxin-antitoxin system
MIVLDTHMVLALLGQVNMVLQPAIENELRGPSKKFVSVASVWEMAIKHRIGKLMLEFDLDDLSSILNRIDIRLLSVTADHALANIGSEPVTKDPFDRLLLGVCASESMKLLTIDRALVRHPLAWRA